MIDNFSVIDGFLNFEEGYFYKFELLVRNTDGENDLFPERASNTNRNILIKSWYVDTPEYYEKIKYEMVTLANITGARLYVTLDRKENSKVVNSLIHAYADTLTAICNGQKPSIKNISKTFASETSKVENSSKTSRTIMFDLDSRNNVLKNAICYYIEQKGQYPYVLNTKKGYHIFCYKKFDHSDWLEEIRLFNDVVYQKLDETILDEEKIVDISSVLSVKANELGLVYHPMKGFTYVVDWQTADQGVDEYLHKAEFENLDTARKFLNELIADPNVVHIEKKGIAVFNDRGAFIGITQ
jgi:hypothetical protein